MVTWNDSDKIRYIDGTGLQYEKYIVTLEHIESVVSKIKNFYFKQRCKLIEENNNLKLVFQRGSKLISTLSPILPTSEKWPYQTIEILFGYKNEAVIIYCFYNVKLYRCYVCTPNAIVTEVNKLQKEFN